MPRQIFKTKRTQKRAGGNVFGLLTGVLAAAGGWVLYSNLAIDHEAVLPEAILAERREFTSEHAGKLSYYADTTHPGRPLLLVHSINAAASSYEMRPLFEHYRRERPVYALDLPGYGFSERSDRPYFPMLFEDAILDFLRTQLNEPADVGALSLGCEFAARAALDEPKLVRSLVLISPTGLGKPKKGSQQAANAGSSDSLYTGFSNPLWSTAFYDLLVTRPSLRFFLKKSFVGPVPDEMVDYAYATSHQPGAEHAPLHFISGKLFTPGVMRTVYELVKPPVLTIYDEDGYTSFEQLPALQERNPSWQSKRIIPSRGLPQWDRTMETTAAMDAFWQGEIG